MLTRHASRILGLAFQLVGLGVLLVGLGVLLVGLGSLLVACGGRIESGVDDGVGESSVSNHRSHGSVGDFNGDKFADFADHSPATGQFWVHASKQDGTFDSAVWGGGATAREGAFETLVGDFNGDGFADYADRYVSTGDFYVHVSNQDGTFAPSGHDYAHGRTAAGGSWETLIADFNGDGFADYADHDTLSGRFYIHLNNQDATFKPSGQNWGAGGQTATGSSWETLVADFNGDGFADYADHHLLSGQLFIHLGNQDGSFQGSGHSWGSATTAVGGDWETLIGDFTGDGFADYADHDLKTGFFTVHENLKDGTFAAGGWGGGRTAVGRDAEVMGYRVNWGNARDCAFWARSRRARTCRTSHMRAPERCAWASS